MRLHQMVLGAALAAFAVHCSSSAPAASQDANVTDGHPGTLVITSPARGAFIESDHDAVEVEGTGATPGLTIDGAPAEVAPDGSFHATVKPEPGLNLVVAVDGESRLETPFLFGHFVAAGIPVPHAVTIDVGPAGISAQAPAASLASVANLALEGKDLVGALEGQTFKGTVTGATWTFDVTGGRNGKAEIALAPTAEGLGVDAKVAAVAVDGKLTLKALGLTYARDVHITVDQAHLTGPVKLSVDAKDGALGAAMPTAETELTGFRFDTDDAGFPCCVDTILTDFMKPNVEKAIRDGVRDEVPKLVRLTLSGAGIPSELDLSSLGLKTPIPLATRFDGAGVDAYGATLSAAVLFGGAFAPDAPGAKAPGWISLGQSKELAASRASALGVSFSIDALNQLMFAAWGTGAVSFTAPPPVDATLTPALPPVVTVTDAGALRVGVGEIRVQRAGAAGPMAAVSVLEDVEPAADHDGLVLTPKGEPTISITWLTDDVADNAKELVAVAAKEQLATFLKPMRIPLPSVALDALGDGFAGQALAVDASSVRVDRGSARVAVAGAAKLVK